MQFLASKWNIWKLWRANARASLVREMEFRANFTLGLVRNLMWFGVFILFVTIIFKQTQTIAGWGKAEMFTILALSRVVEGIMNTLFVHNLMMFPHTVRKGDFDYVLVKPVPSLFYTAFRYFKLENFGSIFAGLALLAYALPRLEVLPNGAQIIAFIAIVLAGITTYYSILVIIASLVFKLERLEALWGFNALLSEPLTVPLDIFPQASRIALTYLIPIAFAVYIPAQALTGRLNAWHIPVAIGIAALFFTLAHIAWNAGVRRYSSASS